MTLDRVPVQDQPEFDDVERIPVIDRLLIWTLMPFVWVHQMVTAPGRVRQENVTFRESQFEPLTDQADAQMPPAVRGFLDASEAALRRIGFGEPRRRLHRNGTSNVSIVPSIAGEDLCVCFVGHVPRRLTMNGVAFQTHLSDGLVIVTVNHDAGSLTSPPKIDAVAFADVKDIAQLYAIHQRRKARALHAGRTPILVGWTPPAADPLELMQRVSDESIDEAVREGFVEGPATSEVRFSAKGARLVAWGTMWPLRQLKEWREARRAARVLRELDL